LGKLAHINAFYWGNLPEFNSKPSTQLKLEMEFTDFWEIFFSEYRWRSISSNCRSIITLGSNVWGSISGHSFMFGSYLQILHFIGDFLGFF